MATSASDEVNNNGNGDFEMDSDSVEIINVEVRRGSF